MTWYFTANSYLISFVSQMMYIHLRILPGKLVWMWKNLWNIVIPGKSQFLVRLIKEDNIANFNSYEKSKHRLSYTKSTSTKKRK